MMLNGVEIDLDTWPWLSPYVEIEGNDAQSVENAAKELGFDMNNATYGPINFIYKREYDIAEQESVSHTPLFFDAPCPWKSK